MFFRESDLIAREHPDLIREVERLDARLATVRSQSPLRPKDFAGVINAEANLVESLFELLAEHGVVAADKMVECDRCQILNSADAFRRAIADEDLFECAGCGAAVPARTQIEVIYRMTPTSLAFALAARSAQRPPPSQTTVPTLAEEPLSDRAQEVLVAMLDLGAIDSDRRQSTEMIAKKASDGDANALKAVMSDLKTRGLIVTKTGRGGGCWLTTSGHARAVKLRDAVGNSATV